MVFIGRTGGGVAIVKGEGEGIWFESEDLSGLERVRRRFCRRRFISICTIG